jgi:hypothetical protein
MNELVERLRVMAEAARSERFDREDERRAKPEGVME